MNQPINHIIEQLSYESSFKSINHLITNLAFVKLTIITGSRRLQKLLAFILSQFLGGTLILGHQKASVF